MIPVQNLYYMLSYVFTALKEEKYKKLGAEEFENAAELCAAILAKGIASQVKRGIYKEYVDKKEPTSVPRGKIDVSASLKSMSIMKQQLVCTYDEFTVNSYFNRIIKSTAEMLIKSDISRSRKKELRRLMVYFDEVDTLDLRSVRWNISYNRNNQSYRLLISVCYLIVKGLLQKTSDGSVKLREFVCGREMSWLYEKFILRYYRAEKPQLKAKSSFIKWQLDSDDDYLLPAMHSDIMLSDKSEENVLIIDAKYYESATQMHFGKRTLISENLYQIFTYVKNKEKELEGKKHTVSGMLLYAKTDEKLLPDNEYIMSGNKIAVKTLDLNCSFDEIKKQLDAIAEPLINS